MKKLYFLCFIFALCGCIVAKATSFPDKAYDDLLVLELENCKSDLSPLNAFVAKYSDVIKAGKATVYITSYSNTLPVSGANSQNATECATMVKDALVKKGIAENLITMESFSGSYDNSHAAAVVQIGIPKGMGKEGYKYTPIVPKQEEIKLAKTTMRFKLEPISEPEPVLVVGRRKAQAKLNSGEEIRFNQVEEVKFKEVREPKVREPRVYPDPKVHEPRPPREPRVRRVIPEPATWSEFNIRTNMLFLAAITPNLGFEVRFGEKSSVMVNGGWAHWNWNDKYRTYRTWYVLPEFRQYLGKHNRCYVGLQGQYGKLNLMLNDTGRQGQFYGGSITGGYVLPVANKLSIDFNLGLGFTQFKYDKYMWMNMDPVNTDVRVVTEKDKKFNLWGPNHVGISLIWHITR